MPWFVYDLAASEVPGLAPLVAEYDGNGNLVAKYHYDGGGLLAMTRNNESYWYGFEGIGTVRQLMGSQGQVLDAYAFDAWGNELMGPQSQVQNPFKYVGKHGYYLDTESALMLLGVRYYGANVGRFMSLDPLTQSINWYSYSNNDPINWLDPLGLWCIKIPFINKCIGNTCYLRPDCPQYQPPKPQPKPLPTPCPRRCPPWRPPSTPDPSPCGGVCRQAANYCRDAPTTSGNVMDECCAGLMDCIECLSNLPSIAIGVCKGSGPAVECLIDCQKNYRNPKQAIERMVICLGKKAIKDILLDLIQNILEDLLENVKR
jgi:RHS repeat-associated protein